MINTIVNIKNQKALTITELMVDLLLSSIVITALIGLYINYKKNYTLQSDNVLINQNAQAVFKYIKDDIQLSGFFGCDSSKENLEYAITPSFDYQLENTISAFEANQTGLNDSFSLDSPGVGWTPEFQGQLNGITPDAGSDALTVRYADTNPSAILQSPTDGFDLEISAAEIGNINLNEIMIISDCFRTVVFQVSSINGNTITTTQSVGNINAYAEIYKINIHSYYIKTADGMPGLYRLSNNIESLLVPNVENMQLLYGQDTDADGITNKFNIASNLTNNTITSIDIGILIKSDNKHLHTQIDDSYKLIASTDQILSTITVNKNNDYYLRKTFDFSLVIPNA